MSFSLITHLRHVDLAVPDYAIQVTFYKDHWGLTGAGSDSGVTYFAAEGSPEQYIVRIRNSQDKRVDLVSFGATDRTAVDDLAQRLGSAGITLVSEPGDLQTPGGGYGFRFFDLEGRTIEVSADVALRSAPQDRGTRGHPRPALPRRAQLAGTREDARLVLRSTSASACPTR